MSPKSIAITPPRRNGARRPAERAEDDAELISLGPVLARPPRRIAAAPQHRYHIGEHLRLSGGGNVLARVGAGCKIISLLPYEGRGPLLYRVRSDSEQFERIVAEADLTRA